MLRRWWWRFLEVVQKTLRFLFGCLSMTLLRSLILVFIKKVHFLFWLFDRFFFGSGSLLPKIIRERSPREGIPSLCPSSNFFFFLHISKSSNVKLYFLFRSVELPSIDFDIFNFFLIFFELSIGLMLSVEMREHFVIDSQFKSLSLLDDIKGKSIESKRILEWYVWGKFIF